LQSSHALVTVWEHACGHAGLEKTRLDLIRARPARVTVGEAHQAVPSVVQSVFWLHAPVVEVFGPEANRKVTGVSGVGAPRTSVTFATTV